MRDFLGQAKVIRERFKGRRSSIDHYQHGYPWGEKQVAKLNGHFTWKFLEDYQAGYARQRVAEYPTFKTDDIEERAQLNRKLAEQVWVPDALLHEVPQ
jgi:hypothetical protein